MTHFDEINLTSLHDSLTKGERDLIGASIRSSDNPAHTALALLRRVVIEDNLDRDQILQALKGLIDLVEYRCISDVEDAVAELRAGDVDHALRILTGPQS